MAASLVLLLPVVLLLMVGLVVLIVLALTARPDHTLPSEVAAARRHALVTSVLAQITFVATIISLVWTATRPADGHVRPTPAWLGALALLGVIAAMAVLLLGEATWPRPRTLQRQANLNARTVRDLLPRAWARALVGMAALTLVVVGAGWWLAGPDGHSVSSYDAARRVGHTGGPFPGSDYGRPQLLALAATLLLLWLVLRLAVLRPAVVRSDVATDNRLRSASVVRAVRLAVSGLSLTCGADLFFGGSAAARVYESSPLQGLAVAAMLLGAVLGLVGGALLLVPAPRLPKDLSGSAPDPRTTTSA